MGTTECECERLTGRLFMWPFDGLANCPGRGPFSHSDNWERLTLPRWPKPTYCLWETLKAPDHWTTSVLRHGQGQTDRDLEINLRPFKRPADLLQLGSGDPSALLDKHLMTCDGQMITCHDRSDLKVTRVRRRSSSSLFLTTRWGQEMSISFPFHPLTCPGWWSVLETLGHFLCFWNVFLFQFSIIVMCSLFISLVKNRSHISNIRPKKVHFLFLR